MSATIAPNIQNWITANQNRILANNCKIKLRLEDLTWLAESGLTGGHISDFVMKGYLLTLAPCKSAVSGWLVKARPTKI